MVVLYPAIAIVKIEIHNEATVVEEAGSKVIHVNNAEF